MSVKLVNIFKTTKQKYINLGSFLCSILYIIVTTKTDCLFKHIIETI